MCTTTGAIAIPDVVGIHSIMSVCRLLRRANARKVAPASGLLNVLRQTHHAAHFPETTTCFNCIERLSVTINLMRRVSPPPRHRIPARLYTVTVVLDHEFLLNPSRRLGLFSEALYTDTRFTTGLPSVQILLFPIAPMICAAGISRETNTWI